MSAPRVWTLAEDRIIIEMRDRGEMWEAIGRRFGIHRTTVINHAKQNGLWTPEFRPGQQEVDKEPTRDWWPLPAGHAETWKPIIAGTMLEGQDYPRP